MSYQALNWAWGQAGLTGPQKFVLVALADMSDEANSCFPSQVRLAEMTGTSTATVRRALKSLEDLGMIQRARRFGSEGYRTSDRYQLILTAQSDQLANSYLTNEATLPLREYDLTAQSEQVTTINPQEPPVGPPAPSRATRLRAGWVPPAAALEWARTKAPSVSDLDIETEKFSNHWIAKPGKDGLKLDWDATWRNWVLRTHQENVRRGWKPGEDYGQDEWLFRA